MNNLLPYAMDFVSYVMENLGREEAISIKNIILFGSTARGEAEKTSDIDIFVNVAENDKKLEKRIQGFKESFFASPRYNGYWKLMGIENEFSVIVDKLDKYRLKDSVISQGITLFGRYIDVPKGHKLKTMLFWNNVKPEIKRVNLFRKLFGHTYKGKRYLGLITKYNGEHLAKNCIIIDSEFENEFLKVFRSMKVPVKIKKMIELS